VLCVLGGALLLPIIIISIGGLIRGQKGCQFGRQVQHCHY
jgi:hypothetical protein